MLVGHHPLETLHVPPFGVDEKRRRDGGDRPERRLPVQHALVREEYGVLQPADLEKQRQQLLAVEVEGDADNRQIGRFGVRPGERIEILELRLAGRTPRREEVDDHGTPPKV